ncbi:MAG: type II CRISPR-associated endonuclease Cas1 [Rhodospirillales bacterium]|nr:type II CRISPR-associated endonuclease Cas1 [Rhodospirillales bacterium]
MAWRGLHLTQAARLSLADHQMVVAQGEGEVRLALEDLAWVVIDTPQATLTTALLSACMQAGIALVMTDAAHTPSGLALPFHRHHRQAHIANVQADASLPLKKRLWQIIVQAKIRNQAASLRAGGIAPGALPAMAELVGSGDPDNVEARAARTYWRLLFPEFVRENADDRRNILLNYGYAVLRAAVARALVASGLLPAFGLQHASASNAFNLADDLVEPFRPFVDRLVWRLSDSGRCKEGAPSLADRRALAALPTEAAFLGAESVTLLVASEQSAESLVRAFEAKSAALLKLPRLSDP